MSDIFNSITENIEPGEIEMLLQFNAITKVFIAAYSTGNEEFMDKIHFIYKLDKLDPEKQKVIGTYDDYKIINKSDVQLEFSEVGLNIDARSKIFKEYDLAQQMAVMITAMEKVLLKNNIEDSDFIEMKSYIDEVLNTNRLRKESLAIDPNFIYKTKEQEYEERNLRLEGGLHEAIGPRVLSDTFISGSSAGI